MRSTSSVRAAGQEREVRAHGVKRTYAWPSESVLKDATTATLKTIATDSGQALRQMLPPAPAVTR